MAQLVPEAGAVIRARVFRKKLEDGGRGERYPYDAWADGKPRRAHEGLDFGTVVTNGSMIIRGAQSAQSFRTSVYAWAKKWGTLATTETDGPDCVIFTIQPLDPVRQAQRDRMYGPHLYNFDHERGYVS